MLKYIQYFNFKLFVSVHNIACVSYLNPIYLLTAKASRSHEESIK